MNNLTPKEILLDSIASILLGLGALGIGSPFLLWWFIHGDYDRYIWIIHGPSPFSSFGSGPFQGDMYILLLLCGGIFVTISLLLKGFIWKELFSSSNTYFRLVRWLIYSFSVTKVFNKTVVLNDYLLLLTCFITVNKEEIYTIGWMNIGLVELF